LPGILFDTAEALLPRFPTTALSWTATRHDSISSVSIFAIDFTAPIDYISPGAGPIFKLRFAVPASQAPGSYPLDTTRVVLPRGLDISYRSGQLIPNVGFVPGVIVVQ
jgi:hypothetical protein